MIKGDQPSALGGRPPVQVRSDLIPEKLHAYHVDDLVKYNILRFLCSHPDAAGDAAYFASNLGFHSIEWTEAVLKELAEAGILTPVGSNTGVTYRLSDNQTMAGEIQNLCVIAVDLPSRSEAIRKLADGSLRHVKKTRTRAS